MYSLLANETAYQQYFNWRYLYNVTRLLFMVVLRGVNHSLLHLLIMQYSVACPFRKQVLHMLENLNFLYLLLFTAMPVYIVSLVSVRCHNFLYFGQHIEIFW
jgi:hypothetical protein